MSTRTLVVAILLIPTLGLMPTPGLATGGPGACRADLQKFCMGTHPDRSRRECLQEHAAELSPGCQERLSRDRAKAAAWSVACHDDVQKLCNKVDTAGGNVARCLRQHQGDLSQACRDQLAKHGQRRHPSAAQ